MTEGHGCWDFANLEQTLRFVQSLPKRERQPLKNKFKNADPQGTPSRPSTSKHPLTFIPTAIELLEKMLVFDPRKRIKAGEALADPYLAPYHDPTDEPVAEEKFDWSFNDADLPVDTWKIMMYATSHASALYSTPFVNIS